MRFVLLGPPGAGKSTVRDRIVEKYELFHLSTGDAFRMEMAKESEIGKLARSYIDEGKLVPDDVVLGIVGAALEGKDNFILDGFPRTVAQAEAFLASDENIDLVFMFDIDFETAYERLHTRVQEAKEAGQDVRSDDQKEVMKKRFVEYESKTAALKDFFGSLGKVALIDARPSKEDVWTQVQDALKSKGF